MNGYSAYQKSAARVETGREMEYRLFGQVTGALRSAQDALSTATATTKLQATKEKVDALLWNREVWSTLKVDLMSPNNALPQDVKGSLISLAIWVEKETAALLSGGDNDLSALIDVNKSIMEGLRPNG